MQFLDKDPFTGIERWMTYDPETRELTETANADVEPNLEFSKSLARDDDYWKQGVKKEMAHYAHIPNILIEKWANEGVDVNDNRELFRMVNKPEYAYLRTTAAHESGR
jgi:hypothetical protein